MIPESYGMYNSKKICPNEKSRTGPFLNPTIKSRKVSINLRNYVDESCSVQQKTSQSAMSNCMLLFQKERGQMKKVLKRPLKT